MRNYILATLAIVTLVAASAVLRSTDSVAADSASVSTSTTTNSTSFVAQPGLVLTPTAGYHWVECLTSVEMPPNATVSLVVALSGAAQPASEVAVKGDGGAASGMGRGVLWTRASVQTTGAQTVSCLWKTSSGTATATTRNLFISKIGGL